MDACVLSDPAFTDLIDRLRHGEEAAAVELVTTYEPELRRFVRIRLTDPRLRSYLDSVDVCQSVLARFFLAIANGRFQLKNPRQLLCLLLRMARNEVCDHARRQQTQRRGGPTTRTMGCCALESLPDSAAGPDAQSANHELVEMVRSELPEAHRYLADQWMLGRGWKELAAELHTDAEVLRKRFTRAIERAVDRLGLKECLSQ